MPVVEMAVTGKNGITYGIIKLFNKQGTFFAESKKT